MARNLNSRSTMPALRVNGSRLWRSLMDLAEIGATEKGGVRRLALSDLDREGRDLVCKWFLDSGLSVTVDQIGNIFARRRGSDPALPPVVSGSHIDTQPSGGKFDGNFGVMAALELVRTMDDAGIRTRAPFEIAIWTNEEGSRFAPVMMGSGVFAGAFSLNHALAQRDMDGISVAEALRAIDYAGTTPVGGRAFAAYFEAHIEQGPILEDLGHAIGVVTGALGLRWYDLLLTGQDSHAGPTPMHLRKDALLGAARIVDGVYRLAIERQPDARATVGFMQVLPNSRNVVPGTVRLSVDMRHPSNQGLDEMETALRAMVNAVTTESRLQAEFNRLTSYAPVTFHPHCVSAIREAAEHLGYRHSDIVSGAGHDACYISRLAPTGMIFVPCEGGISHNEIENAKPDDLEAGCNVLLEAVLAYAGTAV